MNDNYIVYARRAAPGDVPGIEAAVEALFAQLPATKRLGPDIKVLLKPNLLAKHEPGAGVTTHPDVLRAVIHALQKRGVRHITVADSPGGQYTPSVIMALYKACGVWDVCQETGAVAYTECQSGLRQGPGRLVKEFTLLKPVLESDFIINLPKLKTHVLTGMTGAVKNQFGCVPGLQKPEFHMHFPKREHFAQMLVDLSETVNADIHILDGILGMEGDGPAGGACRAFGLLLAGENPYTLDMAQARYMGLSEAELPILAAAKESGLCPPAFDEAWLVGEEDAKQPLPNFAPPRSYSGSMTNLVSLPGPLRPMFRLVSRVIHPHPVIRRNACIGCGKCAEICPQNVITVENKKARIHKKDCIRCFCCHEMCPVKAIDVWRFGMFGH